MRVGTSTEIKTDERRVAITPAGVEAMAARGHEVAIQASAGVGSAIPDSAFGAAGAVVVEGAEAVWDRSEMTLKVKERLEEVKEPLEPEFERMRRGQMLFTYSTWQRRRS